MHRYAHVDSMRALAAVLVVITHAAEFGHFGIPGARSSGDWLYELSYSLDFGRIGVVLFFAISGFVIPSSLRGGQHPGAFWVRRFFRLYPLFWFSIALALITHFWLQGIAVSTTDIAANLTMIPEVFGAPYVQAVYWTLSVELVFYGLCYGLFLCRLNENIRMLAGAALGFAVLFALYQGAETGLFPVMPSFSPLMPGPFVGMTFGHLSIMFFGALCRMLYERHTRSLGFCIAALALFWLILYPLAGWFVLQIASHPAETIRLFLPYSIAIALFLIFLFKVKLRFGFLVWLGQVSYSLYLLHDVVIYALGGLRNTFTPWLVPGVLSYVLISLLAAILVSAITYKLIEHPTHQLGTRLGRKLDERKRMRFPETGHAQRI